MLHEIFQWILWLVALNALEISRHATYISALLSSFLQNDTKYPVRVRHDWEKNEEVTDALTRNIYGKLNVSNGS